MGHANHTITQLRLHSARLQSANRQTPVGTNLHAALHFVAAQQVHHVMCHANADLENAGVLQHLQHPGAEPQPVQRQQQAHRLQGVQQQGTVGVR